MKKKEGKRFYFFLLRLERQENTRDSGNAGVERRVSRLQGTQRGEGGGGGGWY